MVWIEAVKSTGESQARRVECAATEKGNPQRIQMLEWEILAKKLNVSWLFSFSIEKVKEALDSI